MKKNKGFNLISVIVIICISSITSAIMSGVIVTNNYDLTYKGLSNDTELAEFLKTYSNIIDNYYEDIDKTKMLDAAINGMLNYLGDNYTTYLNEEQTKELETRLSGSYEGIGVTLSDNQIIKIEDNSPAAQAGLMVGDKITSVDGTDVTNAPTAISALIKGSDKKEISLGVSRNDQNLIFKVGIASIEISAIEYEMLENNIGYLSISIFSRPLTGQVEKALADLEGKGMKKLIIDLRDNTGGYLDSAETTASLFLEKGKLIYSLEDKKNKEQYKDETEEKRNYPIVVLINENSASSAEILAAALKDSYGASLVGQKSYGKGKVQQTVELEDGSMAKYTSAKWLRPNGECIDGIGLTPDYQTSLVYETDEAGNQIMSVDTQKNKAIEVLTSISD